MIGYPIYDSEFFSKSKFMYFEFINTDLSYNVFSYKAATIKLQLPV